MRKKKLNKQLVRLAFLAFVPFAIFYTLYIDRIYPGIQVAGIDIGGKTITEASQILSQKISVPENLELTSPSTNEVIKIPVNSISLNYQIKDTIDKAYQVGRSGNILFDIDQIAKGLNKKINLGVDVKVDEETLKKDISTIATKLSTNPINPSVSIQNKSIVVDKGKPGTDIDSQKLRVDIGQHLSFLDTSPIPISIVPIDPTLSDSQVKDITQKAQKLIGKKITVNFEDQTVTLDDNTLASLLNPKGGINDEKLTEEINSISKTIERDPQNASFQFVPEVNSAGPATNGKVKEFAPGKDGIKIVVSQLSQKIIDSLNSLIDSDSKEIAIAAPVTKTEPKVKTSDVNNLGIKELIGRGTSLFAGSIPSRVYNINLAASRLNGILIAPGDTFSFNDALGDISVYSGYQQAYIIQDGKTIMGDGGGVCQVSTTLFRAALNAGLPIVERNAHAYRVHYYEEDLGPGYDATIYSPTTDFKFKNDTGNYILIQSHTNTSNLSMDFELYGTSDKRVSSISKSVITSVKPAPAPLYTPDPTLPKGVVKQIDFAASGANVYFNYKVEKDGQVIYEKTFYSNYQPWQAKFLVGTGGA
ncbi:MAG TPA: VanW family protein [Patescibacteria group bacterium]